ncbi:class C sortase [Vagococcus sp.]|uniref:class C sortase n=1 Tax=Vagococcus sp. TaxID=1933889 RepID=UPI003F9C32D9
MKKNRMKLGLDLLMIFLLIIGVGILLYPFVSDTLSDAIDQEILSRYQGELNDEEYEKERKQIEIVQRNKRIAQEGMYPGLNDFNQAISQEERKRLPEQTQKYYVKHTIGSLSIPKIKARLPIFDETNERLLKKGASLLEGTNFVPDSKGTHTVLSAHRGLAGAKLFTDLPELEKGDKFYIDSFGKRYVYEVDGLFVVEPTDTSKLVIDPNVEQVTLLTCTPYMVNSHRLLVRGHRVSADVKKDQAAIEKIEQWKRWKKWGTILGLISLSLLLFFSIFRIIHRFLLRQEKRDIIFQLVSSQGAPLIGLTCELRTKNGKHPVYREGSPIKMITDRVGKGNLTGVPGGKYCLRMEYQGEKYQVIWSLKKIKDRQLTSQTARKSGKLKIKQKKRYVRYTFL